MICPDCKEKKATFRSNKTGGVLRCNGCEEKKEKELGIERTTVFEGAPYTPKDFVPYMLESGPMDKVSDSDPNKCKFNGKRGNGIGDSIHIGSLRDERKYKRIMDVHEVEKGETLQGGIKAELKDKPAKKIYGLKTKSLSSK